MCELADRIKYDGKREGKMEDILALLAELGKVPKRLTNRIMHEGDLNILNKWHMCAARVSSISEFEGKMEHI